MLCAPAVVWESFYSGMIQVFIIMNKYYDFTLMAFC